MIKLIKNSQLTKFIFSTYSIFHSAKKLFTSFKLVVILILVTSCNFEEKLVDARIIDPVRHYYPIIQGEELEIIIELENRSDSPFKITDILTSCGCVVLNRATFDVIPGNSTAFLELTYNSNKNIGLVNHFIYIYGNLKDGDNIEANFDVHVVPDALYTPDYEELYRKEVEKEGGVKNLVDGNESDRGYYISSGDGEGENNRTILKRQ